MLIRNDIEKLSNLFSTWIGNKIIDFKIVLLLNSRIEIHFLVEQLLDEKILFTEYPELQGLEQIVTVYQNEFEEDEDKEWYASDKIDLGLRRRLTNFIEPNNKKIAKPCPILTFYSYKGGTGRTTSLVYFASWIATHYNKKVVIIDCDFEAPGLTNYFDISEERKGVAEYLFDSEYLKFKKEQIPLENYLHKVRYEYVGKGNIYIVPAGNLSNNQINENSKRTHLSDYLECIARIDITSVNRIIEQFEYLFDDLKSQLEIDYENSIILIDSRTGFNDTFAVLSTLSDIIVGFFGINKQSEIGLKYFLNYFGDIENANNKQIVLVNSISESRDYDRIFKEIINDYVSENEAKFLDEEFGLKDFATNTYRVPRKDFLGRLGTKLENLDKGLLKNNGHSSKEPINLEFYEKIQDPDSEFKNFFNGIYEKIDFLLEINNLDNNKKVEYVPIKNFTEQIQYGKNIDNSFFEKLKNNVDNIALREKILTQLINPNVFPKAFSETDKNPPNLFDFFFRDSLKDIFNKDKYVILGYKGTGKTHIYRSFENPEITKTLCKREKQNFDKYIFINVIPISENIKYFSTEDNFKESEKTINNEIGKDVFYKYFWLIYTWSSIFKNNEINKNIKSSIPCFDIIDLNTKQILEIIASRDKITIIQQDLVKVDKHLQNIQKTIILSYDQLDFVVKPNKWNDGVAPLINFWRTNPYLRIHPKIFVRSDIFENRLGNITNFGEIQQEKSISLQWSKPELFAYFFKYVFKVIKEDFFAVSYCYKGYLETSKELLLKINNELDEEGQISLQKEDYLKFLVEKFFGKSAYRFGNRANNFGETYDWFYKNLTDAKNAISIRPFLDLIKTAINMAIEPKKLQDEKKHYYNSIQVLSAYYYASNQAISSAAEKYYEGLTTEQGNEALYLFADFLRLRTTKVEYKKYEFSSYEFGNLLSAVMEKFKNHEKLKEIKNIEDFRHLLISNGIVKLEGQGTKMKHVIPFFYRRYLGVGNPEKINKKFR